MCVYVYVLLIFLFSGSMESMFRTYCEQHTGHIETLLLDKFTW